MSGSKENNYAADTKVKDNPLLRIIGTILFVLAGGFLCYEVIINFRNYFVSALIIIFTSIIILTLWIKSLYIYRYLLPAVIVIFVFTVYPIVYTVYIAFTNYGTGHLLSREDALQEILKGKWDVDYSEKSIFAEIYIPSQYIKDFNEKFKIEKNKAIYEAEKIKKSYIDKMSKKNKKFDPSTVKDDDIIELKDYKDRWINEIEPKIIKDFFSKLKKEEITLVVFNYNNLSISKFGDLREPKKSDETEESIDEDNKKKKVVKDSDIIKEFFEGNIIEDLKIYKSKYVKDDKGENFILEEISLNSVKDIFNRIKEIGNEKKINKDELNSLLDNYKKEWGEILNEIKKYSGDKYNLTEYVIEDFKKYNDGYSYEDDEFYATSYNITLDDLASLQYQFRNEIGLIVNTDNNPKKFLNSIGNEFMKKQKSYTVIDNQIYKLVNNNGKLEYTKKVFPDDKAGKYVVTYDNEKPRYWKEYQIQESGFEYGIFTILSNFEIEQYLSQKVDEMKIKDKIDYGQLSFIKGKAINEVSKDDYNKAKEIVNGFNKIIKDFNSKINSFKDEYIKAKKDEFVKVDEEELNEIKNKRSQIANLKKEIRDLEKMEKNYANYLKMKENKVAIDLLVKDIRQLQKNIRGRKAQLSAIEFPKLSYVKIIVEETSNIDQNEQIEPGYFTTVGFKNFERILSQRNVTSPFLNVFVWTVLWSLFSVLSSFAMGLSLALVFNAGDLKGRIIYRTLFILPYAIPSFVSILMWSGFLNDDFGVLNLALGTNIKWLTDPAGIMPKISCLIVNLWLSFPYMMIISLGALQSIDASMYEAADVDGASKFQQFWLITLPLLLTTLGPMLVGSFAFAFNNFAGIYLLTGGGPVMASGVLPGHTDILISFTYKLAFGESSTDYGLASSIGIIVFMIIGTITFLQFKYTGAFKEVDHA